MYFAVIYGCGRRCASSANRDRVAINPARRDYSARRKVTLPDAKKRPYGLLNKNCRRTLKRKLEDKMILLAGVLSFLPIALIVIVVIVVIRVLVIRVLAARRKNHGGLVVEESKSNLLKIIVGYALLLCAYCFLLFH
jgi:hypothetical protein